MEDGCCTSCGVPQSLAPTLFAELDDERQCYVRQQPQTAAKLDAMIDVIRRQELHCIRYAVSEPALLRRIVDAGEAEACDQLPPPAAAPTG